MDKKYLEWRRKNVTVRGIKDTERTLDTPNSDIAGVMGNGLYSAPISNIRMAKQYGTVYYLVNAIPKNPVVCRSMNEYELFEQDLIKKFCQERGEKYSRSLFDSVTSIDKELLKKGFDGVIIKGREMVNYKPEDVRYYQNERQLLQHYEYVEQNLEEETTAYHGSPYTFDKFSTDNIGGGEGQQRFGWGLYFTDLEGVGRAYAKKLALPKGFYLDNIKVDGILLKDYLKTNVTDYKIDDLDNIFSSESFLEESPLTKEELLNSIYYETKKITDI